MHHTSGGGHAEVGFQMRIVVPAERGHAVAGLEPSAMERFSERPDATIKIHVGVTMNAAIRQARDDFHPWIYLRDALQHGLQGQRVIHHGALHAHALLGMVFGERSAPILAYGFLRAFPRLWLILLPAMKLSRILCLILTIAISAG